MFILLYSKINNRVKNYKKGKKPYQTEMILNL
jgi:hypothetical protein